MMIHKDFKKKFFKKRRAEKKDDSESVQDSTENTVEESPVKKSLPKRILKQFVKTILIRIPILIAGVLAAALLFAKLYLSPERVQNIITTSFNDVSNGKISLQVKEFDLYNGFVMENIIIRNGPEYNNTVFVKIDRLVLKYGVFPIFLGHVRIPEVGIYKPRIYLVEKNGVWNAARLMKPGKEKAEVKEDVPADDKKSSGDIELPISVDFYFKFILDDLGLYMNGSQFKTSVDGFSVSTEIDIPPFKKIPAGPGAVSILKKMKIHVNPSESLNVNFTSSDLSVKPPLILTWKLDFENGAKKSSSFRSILKLGTYKTPVRFVRKHLAPLDFMVSYDLLYNPVTDILIMNDFSVRFKKDKWLSLGGKIKNVTKKQIVDISMKESRISLSSLYPYYRTVTGDWRTRFNGKLSIYPFRIKGTPDDINVDGTVSLKNIFFKNPSVEAGFPLLRLSFGVMKKNSNMDLSSSIYLPHLYYVLQGSRSGDNGFRLHADIKTYNNVERVFIKKLNVAVVNPAMKKNILFLGINGRVNMKPEMKGNIKISKLKFDKNPLPSMLPEKFRKKVDSIPLKEPVTMNMGVDFLLGKKIIQAALEMNLMVPDYKLNDVKLELGVIQNIVKKQVYLKKFAFGSREWNVLLKGSGSIDLAKAPFSDSDLKFSFLFNNPKNKNLYGPWNTSGSLGLKLGLDGDLSTGKVSGELIFDRFNISNSETYLSVSNFDMNFPFVFNFKSKYQGQSLLAVEKSNFIDNKNFREKPNFLIKSIKAKHPARNIAFEYMRDFSAFMEFRDNVFRITDMKAYVLDGSLYGKNILVNLANLDMANLDFKKIKDNIEYRLALDLTNVDVARLDEPDPSKKTREAELSLNANFSGKGVDTKKELSAKGYINIHKIGEEFANKLMKGLSEEKGESKLGLLQPLVDNYYIPKKFNFNLDKGLVYTTVYFDRKLISYLTLTGIKNNKVNFDRIPIQEYLRKVAKGE